MVIAMGIISASTTVQGDSGTLGTPPSYLLAITASASDGPLFAEEPVSVRIPAGTHKPAFNKFIIDAIKAWVDGQNGWVIDPKDIFVQPFDNG
jgi:hypothetical protein